MLGVTYTVYQIPTGEWLVHPDDERFCETFHADGHKCICEQKFPSMTVETVHGYFVDHTPDLEDTGYRVNYKGRKFAVLAHE